MNVANVENVLFPQVDVVGNVENFENVFIVKLCFHCWDCEKEIPFPLINQREENKI